MRLRSLHLEHHRSTPQGALTQITAHGAHRSLAMDMTQITHIDQDSAHSHGAPRYCTWSCLISHMSMTQSMPMSMTRSLHNGAPQITAHGAPQITAHGAPQITAHGLDSITATWSPQITCNMSVDSYHCTWSHPTITAHEKDFRSLHMEHHRSLQHGLTSITAHGHTDHCTWSMTQITAHGAHQILHWSSTDHCTGSTTTITAHEHDSDQLPMEHHNHCPWSATDPCHGAPQSLPGA
eukprot:gene11609-34315_t